MKISKLSLAPLYLALANTSAVYANGRPISDGSSPSKWLPGDPTGGKTIPGIVKTVLDFAIGFAVVVCVGILIFAGYSYMTANGDENKISTATKSLTWAIIGLVVCFVAVILVKFVGKTIFGNEDIFGG